jgi:dTMP kinase
MALLLALEGIDGCGKSSLAHFLVEQLKTLNYCVLLTKEPGATPLGIDLRKIVQERTYTLCPKAEFLLFAADRAQHMSEVVEPALANGTLVISDRMADSSMAYQGFGRGLDKEFIAYVNKWAMNNRIPDITMYIKVDYQTALKRLSARNEKLTVFEQEKADFFQRIISGFDTIFHQRSDVIIVDGLQPFEVLSNQVLTALLDVLKKHA